MADKIAILDQVRDTIRDTHLVLVLLVLVGATSLKRT